MHLHSQSTWGFFNSVIQALREQSSLLDRWELIIIDNGSDFSVESMFSPDIAWHPNSRFVIENNKGFAYCHRRGVLESNSLLTLFLADDCLLAPNYIENAISIMAKNPDVGILTGNVTFTHSKNRSPLVDQMYRATYAPNLVNKFRKDYRKDGYSPSLRGSAGMVVRKSVAQFWLEKFWVYDELMEFLKTYGVLPLRTTDLDFGMQALHHGYCIARSDQLILQHHARDDHTNIKKLLKLAYRSGFFDLIFRTRWGWAMSFPAPFPGNYIVFVKEMLKTSQNLGSWIIRNANFLGIFYAEKIVNGYPDHFNRWHLDT